MPMRNAMNEVLRDWYVDDCQAGVDRWNKILERHGLSDRLRLPDRKFNRGIGQFAGIHFDPNGRMLTDEEWTRRKDEWLPAPADKAYLSEHHERADLRDRQVRQLHRAAAARRQRQAGQLRVRPDGSVGGAWPKSTSARAAGSAS